MSIGLILGVSYLFVLPIISLVIYAACVVASRTSEAAEMRAAQINRMQSHRLVRVRYDSQPAWQRHSLRS